MKRYFEELEKYQKEIESGIYEVNQNELQVLHESIINKTKAIKKEE